MSGLAAFIERFLIFGGDLLEARLVVSTSRFQALVGLAKFGFGGFFCAELVLQFRDLQCCEKAYRRIRELRVLTCFSKDDTVSFCEASKASDFGMIVRVPLTSAPARLTVARTVSSTRDTLVPLLDTPSTGVIRCRLEDSESSSSSY